MTDDPEEHATDPIPSDELPETPEPPAPSDADDGTEPEPKEN